MAGEKKPDPKQAAQPAVKKSAAPAQAAQATQAAAKTGATQGTRTGKVQGAKSVEAENNALLKSLLKVVEGLQAQQAQQAQQKSATSFTEEQIAALNHAIVTGKDEADLKRMMLRFKMMNEYANPESELYKNLSDETMGKFLAEYEQKKKDEADAQKALNQQDMENRIKKYATPNWLKAVQLAANIGGNIASMAGNISQSYRGNLAQALMNAANMGTPGLSAQRAAMYGDPRANTGAATAAQALKQQHIGNRNKIIGDTINNILQGISGGFTSEHLQQRQLRTLLEERPSGAYFQTAWQQAKNSGELARQNSGR